ncbi:MAG: M50 family metallopeptidase [Anaerolineae bacterium]|nr:M50 family metallopeptidase [Phycisphaerae bacterium]
MAWQDRPYYRDRNPSAGNPLMWLLTGSLPLFTAFGIRVRAHASMVVYTILVLVFGLGPGWTWQDRVQNVSILFLIVLLHEFGHCFAARWVGGEANDILMHPLGGLAMASPPRRPLPTFITVAGGPAVNVLICLICGVILWMLSGWVPWNPFGLTKPIRNFEGWLDVWRYLYWIYQISWSLLCFNLLPIFPLDGGQMLQTILWPRFGYYKSMLFSCNAGMVCAVLGAMIALATGSIGLAILAMFGFMYCLQLKRNLIAVGPEEYADTIDYSAAYEINPTKPRRASKRKVKRAAKLAREAVNEQRAIDAILAKVSAHGMQSLSWSEKRTLKKATEHQRQRDVELRSSRRGL